VTKTPVYAVAADGLYTGDIMGAQVVCISRTDGALGEEIGNLVAERLSFRYVDEQVIERAARLAQVDPKLVAAVEQRQRLLRGLIDKLTAARDLVGPATLSVGLPLAAALPERQSYRAKPEDLRLLIQAAIHEIACDGGAVIVAHAASMTLATRNDVVRVLVTASVETRAFRVGAARGVAAETANAAIAEGDRNRQDYLRRFHGIAQELPTHYDLVVNTDVLTPEQATAVIVCAARGRP
jgi:cytidylate kinase